MSDFLKKISAERRQDVARAKKLISLNALQKIASERKLFLSLRARLQSVAEGKNAHIIAEIKRASPSEGALRQDLNPADLAREYEKAGAAGISILTEPNHFLGSEKDLRVVRKAVSLPILRKDFIVEPYQVYESAAWGADVILLIVAALDSALLQELYAAANEARLETIVEVHSAAELETALPLQKAIIGVNNRDLTTLRTDLSTAVALAASIPRESIAIAESGIQSRREIEQLVALGYRGFLIGASLLKAKSPGAALKELIGKTEGTKAPAAAKVMAGRRRHIGTK